MKRKRIEAWAVVDAKTGVLKRVALIDPGATVILGMQGERAVRMVPHNPRADAVVRAARKLVDDVHAGVFEWVESSGEELKRAVARLDAKPRGRK